MFRTKHIVYLIQLIWDDLSNSLYNMSMNEIDPDDYRDDD